MTPYNARILHNLISNESSATAEAYFMDVHNLVQEGNNPEQLLAGALRQVDIANNVIETGVPFTGQTVQGPINITEEDAEDVLIEGLWMVAAIYVYITQTQNENPTVAEIPSTFVQIGVPTVFLNKLPDSAIRLVQGRQATEEPEEKDPGKKTYNDLVKNLSNMVFEYTADEFPEKGNPNVIYHARRDKESFYWDEKTGQYIKDDLLTSFERLFENAIKIQYHALKEVIESVKSDEKGTYEMLVRSARLTDTNATLEALTNKHANFDQVARVIQSPAAIQSLIPALLDMFEDWSSLINQNEEAAIKAVQLFAVMQRLKRKYFVLPTGKILDNLNFFSSMSGGVIRFSATELFLGLLISLSSKGKAANFVKASGANISANAVENAYKEFLSQAVSYLKREDENIEIAARLVFSDFPEILEDLKKDIVMSMAMQNFNNRTRLFDEKDTDSKVTVRGW